MNFLQFISSYYLPLQLEQITDFLKKKKLYDPIEKTINEYYQETKLKIPEGLYIQLILTISDYTSYVNNYLKTVTNADQKEQEQNVLIELTMYLIKETYSTSELPKERYFNILKSTLRKVYSKNNWNFIELDKLLRFDRIVEFIPENKKGKSVIAKSVCLEWRGNMPLDFFISDFKKFFKINSNRSIQYLFQSIITDFEIEIPLEQLPLLLILFDTLHKKKIIKTKGSRGIFAHLENHIKPKNGVFPGRAFRQIRYEISQNKKQYLSLQETINDTFSKYLVRDNRTID